MKIFLWTNICCALLIASSDGTILRLPCTVFADFKISHLGKRLLDHVLMSFNGLQDTECMVKCVENEKCRSYNTNRKDGRCEINGKALADSGTLLKTDPNWVYKSTNYSSNLIGPVCTSLNPCGDKILCKDSCDPPYYKCVYCDADHEGLHCDVAIDRNECSSNPCQNSGKCVEKIADYHCKCLNGFTGKNCETDIDECMSLPCFNGGSCINEIGNYTCNCTTAIGYEGRNCERETDECSSNPCQNSGTCVDQFADYQCTCLNGFTGKNCETDINECLNSPCLHGGGCTNEVGNYTCSCASGYEGRHCETDIDECSSNPCHNSGTCVNKIADYQCTCLNGYTGKDCEIDIDDCINSPCLNGGSCKDEIGNYTCNCTSARGYVGRNCERSQFALYRVHRTWEDARQKCIQLGGDLAIIKTAVELAIVKERFGATLAGLYAWVGLNDSVTEGQFIWNDGTTAMDVDWDTGQPGGRKSENCVLLSFTSGKFHDAPCSHGYFHICEFS